MEQSWKRTLVAAAQNTALGSCVVEAEEFVQAFVNPVETMRNPKVEIPFLHSFDGVPADNSRGFECCRCVIGCFLEDLVQHFFEVFFLRIAQERKKQKKNEDI